MQSVQHQKNMIRLSLVIFFGVISGTITIMSLIIFSPSTIGAIGVTLWFVNLMIFLTSLLGLTFYLSKNKATNNQMIIHNFNSSVRSGFLLSFAITFLLALKSLRSLTIKDVILLGLILLIIEMYFRTKKVRTKKV